MVMPQKAHAACCVARCVQCFKLLAAKVQYITVSQLNSRGLDAATRRCSRLSAGMFYQPCSAGNVVSVRMGFNDIAQL